MPSRECQNPYRIVCCAAQVLGEPRPSWPKVFAVIEKVSGRHSGMLLPPTQALKEAYDEWRQVPRSRAAGF